MTVYRVGPDGNRWPSRAKASAEARRITKRDGTRTYIENEKTGQVVIRYHLAFDGTVKSEKPNSARKKPTKAQKRVNASKRSKLKRVAKALKKYLQQQNPGMKLAGAAIQKLKGVVLKITPIKANRRVKR